MAGKPKIKDLREGRLACPDCSADIHIDDYEGLQVANCPGCNAPVFIPMRVKDFWLYKPLGGGGMGSVYLAISESEGGEFAVKILPREKNTDPQLIETITREGEIGKILGQSPNIVEVVDYGCSEGEYYMASRFVEGTRLDIFISTANHLSERQALDIILQVIDAEIHIIKCGFLFRDIKPENIIVIEETGKVQLFDFGLCLSLDQAANPDPADALEGSPYYLPPERIVAAPEGEHSEIYSLGMLLFHMLSGQTYFSESDIKNLLNKHVGAIRIASVTNRLKHCSPEITAVLDKMIKRDPNQRIKELEPLKKLLLELRDKATGYSLAESGKLKPSQTEDSAEEYRSNKKKRVIGLFFALLLVLIVVGGWLYFNHQESIQLQKEIRIEAAKKLGVPVDIGKPKLSREEIVNQIEKTYRSSFDQQKDKYPPFDDNEARLEICKKYKISTSMTKDPKESISKLRALAKKKIAKETEEKVELQLGTFSADKIRKQIAEKMGLELPISPPTKDLKEIENEITMAAQEKAKEKYPSKDLAAETMNILKKYRSHRQGERVTVLGVASQKISGIYHGKEGGKVIIGNRKVRLNDLLATERIKFNPGLCSSKAAESVKRLRNQFKIKRSEFAKDFIEKSGPAIYKKYGYSLSQDKWLPNAEIVDDRVSKARDKFNKDLKLKKQKIEEKIKKEFDLDKFIRQYGYIKINGKWLSEKAAVAMLMQKKKKTYNADRNKKLKKLKERIRRQTEQKIFKANNYIYFKNRWQPAVDALEKEIMKRQ